jgi:hypothetical protein
MSTADWGGCHLSISGNNVVRSTACKTLINVALSVAERAVRAVAMQHDYYECVRVRSRPDTLFYIHYCIRPISCPTTGALSALHRVRCQPLTWLRCTGRPSEQELNSIGQIKK